MKIVNANEFLKLKSGTLFSMFEDMKFWEFYEKGDTVDGAKCFYRKILTNIKSDNGDDFTEKLTTFDGRSLELDMEWGLFPILNFEKFAIYEKEDIQKLMKILADCL